MDLLIRNAAIYPGPPDGTLIARGHLLIRDGRIAAMGPGGPPATPEPAATLEGEGLLAIPGLVNGHTHSAEVLRRATTDRLRLDAWLAAVWPDLDPLLPEASAAAARLAAVEMLKGGTTAAVDHLRRFPVALPNIEAAAAAYREVGLRVALAVMVRDRPALPGELPPGQDGEEQLAVCEAAAGRWHRPEEGIAVMLGPSGPQRCSDALLRGVAALAERLGLCVHTHLAETRGQVLQSRALDGCGPVDRLAAHGLLAPRCVLAHAVWVNGKDLERLACGGVTVVHNPASNLKLGSGYAPVPRMRALGIRLALGSDGAASNDALDMFEAVKLAALLSRLGEDDPDRWLSAADALGMALQGGAAAMGMPEGPGRLAVGAPADLALLRLDSPALVPLGDPALHLGLCHPTAAVDTVIAGGRMVVRHGRVVTVEEEAVYREARAWGERLRAAARPEQGRGQPCGSS